MANKYISNEWVLLTIFIVSISLIYITDIFLLSNSINDHTILILVITLSLIILKFLPSQKYEKRLFFINFKVVKNSIIAGLLVIIALLPILVINFMDGNISVFNEMYIFSSVKSDFFYSSLSYIFILVCIEELLFRGVAFQIIINKLGENIALFFSAVVFASFHLLNPHISVIALLNLLLAGVLFGSMYIISRSIYPMLVFHFLWNFSIVFILGSQLSGYNYADIENEQGNSLNFIYEYILGGHYGIEGGLYTTLVLILLIFVVRKKQNKEISNN